MQSSHLYTNFFAPRGNQRMLNLGMQIAQQYLNPNDKLIGIIGDAGSGKSMLIKGMFPGLDLCN
ncbi:MAG: alanine-tRNA synthetase second additional domain-containing protein, partial [Firmicutes bacterium]|nr:alanine-tRNA synthetase second additional domain-containing protein [Bacillota bacterium]